MRVVLYSRVSTEEQAKTGYSVKEQLHTLREHASGNLEVVEEVSDEGYSGADPDRPGLLRVMELAESGEIDAVVAVKRDRLFRSRLYRLLLERDLAEFGVELIALNDTGHMIGDGVMDSFAEWEREEITRRTLSGKRQKAREGKVIAGRLPVYGFRFSADRDHYEVDEARMIAVRRLFELVASGKSIAGTARILDEEGYPAPQGTRWQRPTIRSAVLDDAYKPHLREEIETLVTPEVARSLTEESYGVWWYDRREVVKTRRGKRVREKPRSEWIAVPVPDAGIPPETVERARQAVIGNERASSAGRRKWELSGGILRCAECGCALVAHTSTDHYETKKRGRVERGRYYYRCATYRRLGREGCPNSRNLTAEKTEGLVWQAVRSAVTEPDRLESALAEVSKDKRQEGDTARLERVLARLSEIERRRDALIDLALDGPLSKEELRGRLAPLDEDLARLRSEADTLTSRQEREGNVTRDARMVLRALKEVAPQALDDLDGEGRRELYRDIRLKVLSERDGSLRLSLLVDLDTGAIRWETVGTSIR